MQVLQIFRFRFCSGFRFRFRFKVRHQTAKGHFVLWVPPILSGGGGGLTGSIHFKPPAGGTSDLFFRCRRGGGFLPGRKSLGYAQSSQAGRRGGLEASDVPSSPPGGLKQHLKQKGSRKYGGIPFKVTLRWRGRFRDIFASSIRSTV
jgi:hypothetical protein